METAPELFSLLIPLLSHHLRGKLHIYLDLGLGILCLGVAHDWHDRLGGHLSQDLVGYLPHLICRYFFLLLV